jgi:hypothetical protein
VTLNDRHVSVAAVLYGIVADESCPFTSR